MANRRIIEDGYPIFKENEWIAKPGAQAGALILKEINITKEGKGNKKYWICECLKCGNITSKREDNLKVGACGGKTYSSGRFCAGTRSCGCKQDTSFTAANKEGTQITKYIDKNYAGLTIIYSTNYSDNNRSKIVMCQCPKCNKIFPTTTRNTNKTCGHCDLKEYPITLDEYICNKKAKSAGEEKIFSLLNKNNISFQDEKKFVECKDINPLPFDFYIENQKTIIEFDGEQHFKEVSYFGKLETRRKHDLIKNKFCFDNDISLIRIPFDAEYTISDLNPNTTRFLLTPENEKEYYESRIK